MACWADLEQPPPSCDISCHSAQNPKRLLGCPCPMFVSAVKPRLLQSHWSCSWALSIKANLPCARTDSWHLDVQPGFRIGHGHGHQSAQFQGNQPSPPPPESSRNDDPIFKAEKCCIICYLLLEWNIQACSIGSLLCSNNFASDEAPTRNCSGMKAYCCPSTTWFVVIGDLN